MKEGDSEETGGGGTSICEVLSQGPGILCEEGRIQMASWYVLGLPRMAAYVTWGKVQRKSEFRKWMMKVWLRHAEPRDHVEQRAMPMRHGM